MFEGQHFVFATVQFYVMHKLVKKTGSEMEGEYINGLVFATAVIGWQFHTLCTAFLFTITVTGNTVPQLEVIVCGLFGVVMIHEHTGILSYPWVLCIIAPDIVLDGTGDLLAFFV
jgi:hypothetical protein